MTTGTLDEFLAVARGQSRTNSEIDFIPPADAGNPDAPCRGLFATLWGGLLTGNAAPRIVRVDAGAQTKVDAKRRHNRKLTGQRV